MSVRTRFAPSPTGYLHIGGVRTALFCWLFARRNQGKFILRIDDTDQERNVDEALQPILDGLRWLGIDWDEGPDVGGPFAPYYQSQRADRHRAAVARLLDAGAAYRDYATTEEIQAEREAALSEKRPFVYSRRLMAETPQDRARFEAQGRQAVVRLKMPREGALVLDDLVRGPTRFEWAQEQDHVIQRADGSCLYHLASAVDDHDLEITHVIRAEEHLSNTPRQVFIAQSLGYPLPEYAHLPYVAEPGSKSKLSKRKLAKYLKNRDFAQRVEHGEKIARALGLKTSPETFNPVIVDFYRQVGYLPEAILNYLALLGWSLDDSREHFTRQQLIENFSLERINKAPASLDPQKLWAFQDRHMQQLPVEEKLPLILPYLQKAGLVPDPAPDEVKTKLSRILQAAGDRIKVCGDILDYTGLFLPDDQFPYDQQAFDKRLRQKDVPLLLTEFREQIQELASFSAEGLRAAFLKAVQPDVATPGTTAGAVSPQLYDALQRDLAIAEALSFDAVRLEKAHTQDFTAARAMKLGEIVHAIRIALTGKPIGFGVFDCMCILGRDSCIRRIDRTLNMLGAQKGGPLSRFQEIPEALEPAFDFGSVKDSILLLKGSMDLVKGKQLVSGEGEVTLHWLPDAVIRFTLRPEGAALSSEVLSLGACELHIPSLGAQTDALLTNLELASGKSTILSGIPNGRFVTEKRNDLTNVVFHLPDFHDYVGKPVRKQNRSWAGRLILQEEKWKITIDALPDARKKRREVAELGGSVVTHVGRLEREDGSSFSSEESDDLIESLQYFLSFIRGFWVSPFLLVGFDAKGGKVWQDWTLRRFDQWQYVFSWCPVHRMADVAEFYPEFSRRWRLRNWRELMRTAIYWYLLSNHGGTIDRSVITLQIVLEVVAEFAETVASGQPPDWLHPGEGVLDRLTRLCRKANIPAEVPPGLTGLQGFARAQSASSALAALRAIRDANLHPYGRGCQLLDAMREHEHAHFDAWRLGMRYVELAMLWAFGYKGQYQDRITSKWVGHSEPVPWEDVLQPSSAAVDFHG